MNRRFHSGRWGVAGLLSLSGLLLAASMAPAAAAAAAAPGRSHDLRAAQAAPVSEWSAQRRRPRRVAPPPAYVACTYGGCHPLPPGCFPVTGRDWRGNLTGYDQVVCRPR